MAAYWSIVGLVIGLGQNSAGTPPPATAAKAQGMSIPRLIAQLGSSRFQEREAATGALDRLGAASLEPLAKAAGAADLEVRRRALALVRRIRQRLQTAQILQPKRVRLVYEDTPLAEAVDVLARKAGFAIRLGPHADFGNRRVTLDTGETTFWEAMDQLCRKAGLIEYPLAADPVVPRTWNPNGGFGPPAVAFQHRAVVSGAEGELILTDGEPPSAPTYYAGAVRIRALPPAGTVWARNSSPGETFLLLDVTPQPQMGWEQLVAVDLVRAVDEHGQNLTPVPAASGPRLDFGRFPNGRLQLPEPTRPFNLARERAIRLKQAAQPAHQLRLVEGLVQARVRTPLEPVVTVENVLSAAGRTVPGSEGGWLKVLEVERLGEGAVRLRVRFAEPSQGGEAWARNAFLMRRRRWMAGNGMVLRAGMLERALRAGDLGLALLDAHGQSIPLASIDSEQMMVNLNGLSWEVELVYRAHDGQAEPAKLVLSGRREVVIEIPFQLRDVPLP